MFVGQIIGSYISKYVKCNEKAIKVIVLFIFSLEVALFIKLHLLYLLAIRLALGINIGILSISGPNYVLKHTE